MQSPPDTFGCCTEFCIVSGPLFLTIDSIHPLQSSPRTGLSTWTRTATHDRRLSFARPSAGPRSPGVRPCARLPSRSLWASYKNSYSTVDAITDDVSLDAIVHDSSSSTSSSSSSSSTSSSKYRAPLSTPRVCWTAAQTTHSLPANTSGRRPFFV